MSFNRASNGQSVAGRANGLVPSHTAEQHTTHEERLQRRCEFNRSRFLADKIPLPFYVDSELPSSLPHVHLPSRKLGPPQSVAIGEGVLKADLAPTRPEFGKTKPVDTAAGGTGGGGFVLAWVPPAPASARGAPLLNGSTALELEQGAPPHTARHPGAPLLPPIAIETTAKYIHKPHAEETHVNLFHTRRSIRPAEDHATPGVRALRLQPIQSAVLAPYATLTNLVVDPDVHKPTGKSKRWTAERWAHGV